MDGPVHVLVSHAFKPAQLKQLEGVSPRLRIQQLAAAKADEVPADTWARCEVLYTDRLLPSPEQAPNLKWIQFHYAGLDRFLQEPALNMPGIQVTTLSGAAAPQMAEHILMMMLALARHLPDAMQLQDKKEWPKDRFERFRPLELRDATVGILGYGSIGREVARLLTGFNATVLAIKQNAMQPVDTGYSPEGQGDPGGDFAQRIYPPQAIKSMLKICDFIIICAPLTPKTRNLINAATLESCKPGAYLVDVSRGGIVDHQALLKALHNGALGGAALDVFPEEPLPAKSPLWDAPNLLITPHVSGNSKHYDQRATDLFAENLLRYIGGLPLFNSIDPQRGY